MQQENWLHLMIFEPNTKTSRDEAITSAQCAHLMNERLQKTCYMFLQTVKECCFHLTQLLSSSSSRYALKIEYLARILSWGFFLLLTCWALIYLDFHQKEIKILLQQPKMVSSEISGDHCLETALNSCVLLHLFIRSAIVVVFCNISTTATMDWWEQKTNSYKKCWTSKTHLLSWTTLNIGQTYKTNWINQHQYKALQLLLSCAVAERTVLMLLRYFYI